MWRWMYSIFNKKKLSVLKNKEVILQEVQNWQDDLWDIPIKQPNITTHNYKTPTSHTGPYTNSVANITEKQCEQFINNQQHQDRNSFDKIYQVAKLQSTNHKLAVIIRKKQTHRDLARYLPATCFSAVKHTWIQAIKRNHFISWTGLTQDLLQKQIPLIHATVQGHMHKQQQNL